MKLAAEQKVVAGVHRGGEDVMVALTAEFDGSTDAALTKELRNVDGAIDALFAELSGEDEDERYDELGYATVDELWRGVGVVGGVVIFGDRLVTEGSEHYDINVDVSLDQARKDIAAALREKSNWQCVRKPGAKKSQWTLAVDLWCDGNAE